MFLLAILLAIAAASVVVGVVMVRTFRQIEQLPLQSVIEATLSLANDKVERLDRLIIDQDNALANELDLNDLSQLSRQWQPHTRETPTVQSLLVLDLSLPRHPVIAYASRSPGPEDEVFRRLLVTPFFSDLVLDTPPLEGLRHLHRPHRDQSYLLSYWQRTIGTHRYLVIARHDIGAIIHNVFPRLYSDTSGSSRVAILDEEGRLVFGTPLHAGEFTVGRPFPTTLYGWRLQVALVATDDLSERVQRRRVLEIALIITACAIIVLGTLSLLVAAENERRTSMQKSEFVANVSHELKTPISLIRMFTELLLMRRAPEEKQAEYLQIIHLETERLTALVENVLDFARLDQGKVRYEMAPLDVSEAIGSAVEVFRHRATRAGVQVVFERGEQPVEILGDKRMIEQALFNLLDNALKYAPGSAHIWVQLRQEPHAVEITVRDEGPGVTPEERRRIFQRFVRGRLAAQARGSGIGLSLVKSIMEGHHGEVHLDPSSGSGATFVLRFPRAAPHPQATASAPSVERESNARLSIQDPPQSTLEPPTSPVLASQDAAASMEASSKKPA